MDSEDALQLYTYDGTPPERVDIPLKLNVDLEQQVYRQACLLNLASTIGNPDASPAVDPREAASVYRVDRFLRTVEGFFSGSLDLTGRHAPRYTSVMASWIKFIHDLNEVKLHNLRVQLYGTAYDEAIVRHFRNKWWLPESYLPWDVLVGAIDGVQNFIAQRRDPQLQRRTLLDIPPEIHDMMMQVAEDVDATALGQTCRSLRAASARHLSHRNFFIREIDDLEGEDLHEVPPKLMNIYTQACVLNECRRVLNNIRIALSRIDILHNIKSLQICDFSSDRTWRRAQLPRNSKEYPHFFRPISLDIARVLSSAPKITKLAICKFVLSEEMFAAMSQMPVLETLELTNCSYRQGRWLTDIIPGGIPTVRNVMFGGVRYDDVWVFEMLSLLPMVRSLSLMGSEQGAFFPSMVGMEGFLTRTHAFCVAERLIVRCFDEEVPYLRAWLFLAKQRVHGEHLNLTHFKLEVQDGGSRYERLTRSRLFDLIDVLKDAPLGTLALEGVSYAGLDAFTHIAEKCPNLRALTVVYRQDWWHVSSMPCIWPHALWEYAYSLGDLRSLNHFGSNMAVEPLLRVRYWLDDFMAGDRFRGYDTREEDFYYEEREVASVARLLAGPCENLQSVVFLSCEGVALGLEMSRGDDGSVSSIDEIQLSTQLTSKLNAFNPSEMSLNMNTNPWLV